MPQTLSLDALAKQFGGSVSDAAAAPPVAGKPDLDALASDLGGSSTSFDDLITSIATEHGLDPKLALAVAKRESSMDPSAVGDKDLPGGPSLGLFQLRPGTAKDMGVDPSDPRQNITGGVKYLKQLHDRFGGDLSKTLMAYNGGPEHIDAGDVSPAAQAYAADVLKSLGVEPPPTTPPPTAGLGALSKAETITAAPGLATDLWRTGKHIGKDIVIPAATAIAKANDPRTPEGRLNLATMIATAAVTKGIPLPTFLRAGVAPWIARVTSAPLVAGATGAGEVALENAAGTSTENPWTAGGMQAVYELGGQAFAWPFRTALKDMTVGTVARQAKAELSRQSRNLLSAGRDTMEALRDSLMRGVDVVREAGATKTAAVKEAGESATRYAADNAAARLAQAELDASRRVASVTAQYGKMMGETPSVLEAGQAAREVVGGMPGLKDMPTGPAKRALDLVGEKVLEAAKHGPMVDIVPVQQELAKMGKETIPTSILERSAAAQRGEMSEMVGTKLSELSPAAQEALVASGKIPASALLPAEHPLPKLLGEFQMAGQSSIARDGKIPFLEAHKWKKMLDDAVDFDEKSRNMVEGLTKGLRSKLREAMAGYAPYDEATAAYQKLVPLYEKGVGRELILAAAKDPDKVARLIDIKEPANAIALHSLLVGQSAAGGDAELGQRAWDAVRSRFTYDKILHGGVDGLADRVEQMVKENPEFTKAVFGDPSSSRILTNAHEIGMAARKVAEETGNQVSRTKAIGKASVEEARAVAGYAAEKVQQEGTEAVRAATRRAASTTRATQRSIQEGKEAVGEKLQNLSESSVGPFIARRAGENVAVDTGRAALLGPTNRAGALSIIRLLRGPRSDELLEWAAYSNDNTKRMVRILLDPLWDRGAASLIRDMGTAVFHKQESPPKQPPQR